MITPARMLVYDKEADIKMIGRKPRYSANIFYLPIDNYYGL